MCSILECTLSFEWSSIVAQTIAFDGICLKHFDKEYSGILKTEAF
jgi:hypothetical protein